MMKWLLFLSVLCYGLRGQAAPFYDPDSFANFQQVYSESLVLDLTVDFTRQQLSGSVVHHLRWLDPSNRRFIVDTRDLTIEHVDYLGSDGHWQKANYLLSTGDPIRGKPLHIQLPQQSPSVRIFYSTRAGSSALQWLSAQQSTDKKHPFLYTQSQAIHARSWIPLQDTPAIRHPYKANLRIPTELSAVMSANLVQSSPERGLYQFEMRQPIPSYLIALAVGDIHFKAIDKESGVYGEPSTLVDSANNFSDVSKLIKEANGLFGDFAWGRYDLLVLPSSFPFGGMEYPQIAFVTPTVITGDKSLVNMVAHELAHAWSGNLVTNANWQELWLNEGLTSYVEHRLVAKVYGKQRAEQDFSLNVAELAERLRVMPAQKTKLRQVWDVQQDPEQLFNPIAYTKGHLFFYWLAGTVGQDEFDLYLRGYFQRHAFQSIDSTLFIEDIKEHLITPYHLDISNAQLQEWLEGTGLPSFVRLPTANVFADVDRTIELWIGQQLPINTISTQDWTVQDWLHFLRKVPRQLSQAQVAELESKFGFSSSQNAEIFTEWALLVIPLRHSIIDEPLRKFLLNVGRIRYLEQIYRSLANTPQRVDWMRRVYREARASYHPQAQQVLDAIAL